MEDDSYDSRTLAQQVPAWRVREFWESWIQDPVAAIVIPALLSYSRTISNQAFQKDLLQALTQKPVCFLHSSLRATALLKHHQNDITLNNCFIGLIDHPEIWGSAAKHESPLLRGRDMF
jgi:hypothetical protein